MLQKSHIPVMLNEVIGFLNLEPGKVIVDATTGYGGHSLKILEKISPGGRLICLDQDDAALVLAGERLANTPGNFKLVKSNFSDIDKALNELKMEKVDGVLFDLGVSSLQLDDPQRGFSFQGDGPLDMRLDQSGDFNAYDLVNSWSEDEISEIIRDFGEERWHNRIARAIVFARDKQPISTTRELADIITKAVPGRFRYQRIHPATRTFQAIRIAVNHELEALEIALRKTVDLLNPGGRMCVISFHSLEDRIVKFSFREFEKKGILKILTPKPLVPLDAEMAINPRSRSAKLRAAER